MNSKADKNLSL